MANLISRTTIYLHRPKNQPKQSVADKKVDNNAKEKKSVSRTIIYLNRPKNDTKEV